MPTMHGVPDRDEVLRLTDEGLRLYAQGDPAAGVDRYQRACAIVREALEAGLEDPDDIRQLASMLYTLGEWLLEGDTFSAAVEALDEAEALYRRLGGAAVLEAVDVVIRRARVHATAGRPLSAVTDAQNAVIASLEWAVDDPADTSRSHDCARVIALAGYVQLISGGDPDLAVAAADRALQAYLAGLRPGNEFAVPAGHVPAFWHAAWTATVVHAAAGRTEVAEAARSLLLLVSPGGPTDLGGYVHAVRSDHPTLADVLGQAGRRDLADALTAPATDVRILAPAMRCPAQLAPVHAQALLDLQGRVSARADILLGLEAHALFAAASRAQVPAMRYQFGDFGPKWASVVLNLGQRMAEQDGMTAAVDAADWLSGILRQLAPFTALPDSPAHFTAAACASWQHSVYTEVGDTAAAAHAAQLLRILGSA